MGIMAWTNTLLQPAFSHLDEQWQFSIVEYVDYVLSEKKNASNIKKIAGNAQKISRDRFDHHTSWLWQYDIEQINKYLAIPPMKKQPEYRNDRSHEDFLLCLRINCWKDCKLCLRLRNYQSIKHWKLQEISR